MRAPPCLKSKFGPAGKTPAAHAEHAPCFFVFGHIIGAAGTVAQEGARGKRTHLEVIGGGIFSPAIIMQSWSLNRAAPCQITMTAQKWETAPSRDIRVPVLSGTRS